MPPLLPFRPAIPLFAFLLIVGSITQPCVAQEAPWPTEGWATSTPEAEGLQAPVFTTLDSEIRDGLYGYVDRMVVVRNGRLVVDEQYDHDYRAISKGAQSELGCGAETCVDEAAAADPYNYYHPSTHPFYQGREVHSLQSVTKSVSATLIGVALHRGEINSLETPLLSFFGNYDLSKVDDRLRKATLEDLLTMRSGIEWHEQDRPLDETNTTLQLERSDDWIQFTLDQPSDAAPGWGYGYQWWRLDREEVEVWAGLGFGGQFLLILPEHNLIGVVNSWNLFGRQQRSILGGFLTALLAAVE